MKPKTLDYPFTSADVNVQRIEEWTDALMKRGVEYGFGSKARVLESPPQLFSGTKGLCVDCSGFVRWLLWDDIELPDGSVNQRDFLKANGFKPSKQFDEVDGRVRIAFLSPGQTPSGIGHVMVVLNGKTMESHGGRGVDRRIWGSKPWMSRCSGFVIDPRSQG